MPLIILFNSDRKTIVTQCVSQERPAVRDPEKHKTSLFLTTRLKCLRVSELSGWMCLINLWNEESGTDFISVAVILHK